MRVEKHCWRADGCNSRQELFLERFSNLNVGGCYMVEIIGLVTFVALTWLLASTMAAESEAERRRFSKLAGNLDSGGEGTTGSRAKHAA